MAQLTMTLKTRVYGLRVAKALGWTLMKLGVGEETACRWAMRCVFVRMQAGGRHKSWVWGGR